jgi:hypothetical protein
MAKPCKHLKGLTAADFRRQKTPVTWCYVHDAYQKRQRHIEVDPWLLESMT